MVHFEVDADDLQRDVPFELDLWEGRAFVSLVAFTMRGLRPRFGGPALAWLFRPLGTHRFLNVRTYVRHRGEPGILFLAEWLDNPLSIRLGPLIFGLPYRLGRLDYRHGHETAKVEGSVLDSAGQGGFSYEAELPVPFGLEDCLCGSLDEFLMSATQLYHPGDVSFVSGLGRGSKAGRA
jgi:hypothetical protein